MDEASHVLAGSTLHRGRTRVLKQGDTFAVFDEYGDIRSENSESGVYSDGTRFLSQFEAELEGARPFLLSSTVRDDNDQLVVTLTNPDLCRGGEIYLALGCLQLEWRKLLWHCVLYQELRVVNHGQADVDFRIAIRFAADYADIFEVRGMRRQVHGSVLSPRLTDRTVTLCYRGLDNVERRTVLEFDSRATRLTANSASYDVRLAPAQEGVIGVTVACERESIRHTSLSFASARNEAKADLESQTAQFARIETANGEFDALVRRSASDLHMLTTVLPTGPYPYAGVPWFNTPFGRDGLITALECLWLHPALARGVLAYLAQTQATSTIPQQDAEPGRILHETRKGEMAATGEMPFAQYYGTVDATPLFVLLAGAYFTRTADLDFIRHIWPNIEAALHWMAEYGDRDSDGFIEYSGHAGQGLLHQGWKDSDDAVFHADGSPACGPIALCEVQAYAYGAWQAAAKMAVGLDLPATEFRHRAAVLREGFERDFWCEEMSRYALALDGRKRPCRVRTSNAGQCLFTGIASEARAARVAEALLAPESFSGWGIRTLAMGEPRYNPMGYHTGSVWPHDNALIAAGLFRYGLVSEAMQIFAGFFDAAMTCDLHRVPELFCGLLREPGEGPIPYPVACAPQAWSSGAIFLLLQECLGITFNALTREIRFSRPALPPFLRHVTIRNLRLSDASIDLTVIRHGADVSVHVERQEGEAEVIVLP